MDRRTALTVGVLAFLFVALHLPFLPRSLEDVDSINFALGIRDFDVARHQPHPPGYPLFIVVAKAAHVLIRPEARALAAVNVVAGALSILALVALFSRLTAGSSGSAGRDVPITAAMLAITAPLFWVTAARPLSDVTGLAAALGVQAMTLGATAPAGLALAAFLAALGVGVRSQVLWLTIPLLVLAILRHVRLKPDRWRAVLWPLAAFAVGTLVWAVPLVVLTGGPAAYWQTVVNQGAEDLSGVAMFSTTPTPRQLALDLYHVFFAPWGLWPFGLVMAAAATIGAARLIRRNGAALVTLGAAFIPYFLFDLFFQETVTSRYALPFVVPIAYLAAQGAAILPRSAAAVIAVLVACVSLAVAGPAVYAYSREEAPAFRLLAEMHSVLSEAGASPNRAPVLAMHRRAEFDLRRPFAWTEPDSPLFGARLPAPPKHEWLQLVNYWNSGGRRPIWFVADPLRSDLALIEHAPPRTYRWAIDQPVLFGGMRPNEMDWYSINPPDWYLGEGWAITPESAGVVREDGREPGVRPIQGWIRRWPVPSTLMIGGRNLADGGGAGLVRIDIDGRQVDEASVAPGFFLRMIDVPAFDPATGGDYATVTVTADRQNLAIEQFDAKPRRRRGRCRRQHIGGLVVEPQVGEWRRHHTPGASPFSSFGVHVPLSELVLADGAAVNGDQPVAEAARRGDIGELRRAALLPRRPLGEVVDQGAALIEQRTAIVEFGFREVDHRRSDRVGIDAVVDAANELVRRAGIGVGPALDRRGATGEGTHLCVGEQRLWCALEVGVCRPAHGRLVRRGVRPQVTVQPRTCRARRLVPQRQRCESEVGMQVGEPGVDEGVADVDLSGTWRRALTTMQHRVDRATVEAHAAGEVLLRVGHRHRHDVALNLEHHRFRSSCAAAASCRRQRRRPKAGRPGRHRDLVVVERC